MAVFSFRALNQAGEEVRDEIEANSNEEAITKIRNMGYYPTRVETKGGRKVGAVQARVAKKGKSLAFGKVKKKHLTSFSRQLSTLQDAGLPIVRSIKILEGQQKPGVLKNALIDVADDVEGGSTFSEALAKHPKAFDKLYVNMIKAGETGGVLDTILRRLADFLEKTQRLRRKIVGAMIYPVVVIVVAIGIVTFIMLRIIPEFAKVFAQFDLELPALTRALIAISNWVVRWWPVLLLVPIVLYIVVKIAKQFRPGRYVIDKMKFKAPIFGQIVRKASISRFSRTLGTLITSGVPILEALNISRETAGNEVIARALGRVHDSIREGESIAEPLKQSRVCDDIVVNMIDVGEETGDLDKMLLKVADNYDDEVDTLVSSMMSLLEPLIVIILGGIVGFIVISLFMPLVSLMTSLSGKAGAK